VISCILDYLIVVIKVIFIINIFYCYFYYICFILDFLDEETHRYKKSEKNRTRMHCDPLDLEENFYCQHFFIFGNPTNIVIAAFFNIKYT
jgi:hypothetical protein